MKLIKALMALSLRNKMIIAFSGTLLPMVLRIRDVLDR